MKRLMFVAMLMGLSAYGYVVYVDGNRSFDNLSLGIPNEPDQIVDREGYALGFSRAWKQPMWVTYRLTKEEVQNNKVKRSNKFKTDDMVVGSATPGDYTRSGYDRGHLAPAADMQWSAKAMTDSFYMSNMSPQTPTLNRDVWMRMETFTRDCAVKEEHVFVVSGPIVTNRYPKTIGANRVVVPDLFYKIIYDETPPEKMVAFILPNVKISGDIWNYATNVVYIEEMSGLHFFPAADQNKMNYLKSNFNKLEWIE